MKNIHTQVGRGALESVKTTDFIGFCECARRGVNASAPHFALKFIESEFPPASAGC